jgi:hypothetical protein
MKSILLALLVFVTTSCMDAGDRYVKKFEMVNISKSTIPDTTFNLDYMEIRAKAQADNGCWRDLYFELKKTGEFEYSLKAFGTFESFGVCDAVIVTKDTAILFQPTIKGTYLFHISRMPNEIVTDTMIVE